eukprot:CAMPEP_0203958240 /NCGR_PEP_ID=MMETSP0359-20131031/89782_1 /ASSEMBLY_ACC=CAM_ASM_000338 /TAXON_ID=268821 /ORGANISM="Scrippsiella Hangoei, Strain SHTV-5" /LENGTH=49 /DNA_ID= /DNA_START= /DNA_END= /DNA_ORIENTATION=
MEHALTTGDRKMTAVQPAQRPKTPLGPCAILLACSHHPDGTLSAPKGFA